MRALLVTVTAVALAVAIAAGVIAVSERVSAGAAQSAIDRDTAIAEQQEAAQAALARQVDDLGRQTTAVRLAIANASGSARMLGFEFDALTRARQRVTDLVNQSLTTATLSASERAAFTRALDELARQYTALVNAQSDLATNAEQLQP